MAETTLKPDTSSNNLEKPYNLEPNVEAMLCYLPVIGFFMSVVALTNEKNNMFVRFHALQSLLLTMTYVVLAMGLGLTKVLDFLVSLLKIATFVLWLFMMWKAYENQEIELPFIGKIARDQLKKK